MISIDKIPNQGVALRKESMDRKSVPFRPASHLSKSLSARRAWIESVTGY